MKLTINKHIYDQDLSGRVQYITWAKENGYLEEKKNHHYLLSFLVSQLPSDSIVADLGTLYGASALSLSMNPNVHVVSYDIERHFPLDKPSCYDLENVHFTQADCLTCIDSFIDAKIILLDLDPHDGVQETKMIATLLEKHYEGIVVCDDINLNEQMKAFWSTVQLKKIDVTEYGHWSGTGIIIFDEKKVDIEVITG